MTVFEPSVLTHYPAPPTLGGGLKPTEWLRSVALADDKKKANARAREARAIADWLDQMGRWLGEQAFAPWPTITPKKEEA